MARVEVTSGKKDLGTSPYEGPTNHSFHGWNLSGKQMEELLDYHPKEAEDPNPQAESHRDKTVSVLSELRVPFVS